MSDLGDTPFHYSGIFVELSEGLKHVLQAQDWLERAPLGTSSDTARRSERGNLIAALTHLKNAFAALDERYSAVNLRLRLTERHAMEATAEEIARLSDATPLPISPTPPTATLADVPPER